MEWRDLEFGFDFLVGNSFQLLFFFLDDLHFFYFLRSLLQDSFLCLHGAKSPDFVIHVKSLFVFFVELVL